MAGHPRGWPAFCCWAHGLGSQRHSVNSPAAPRWGWHRGFDVKPTRTASIDELAIVVTMSGSPAAGRSKR